MNHRNWFTILAVLLATLLLTSVLPAITPVIRRAEAQQLTKEMRNWEYLNHDRLGTNYNPQNIINKDNVEFLELKWIYPIPSADQVGAGGFVGFGGITEGTMAPPLIVDGVVYIVLQRKTVIALDATDGSVLWTFENEFDNDVASIQNGGIAPITPQGTHTHGMYFEDGILRFTDFGCTQIALNAQTGELIRRYGDLCLDFPVDPNDFAADPRGLGVATNSGLYSGGGGHPAMIYKGGNMFIFNSGGAFEGTWGARLFVAGFDLTTGERRWRTFLAPPCADPETCGPGKDGPLFVEEKAEWGQFLVDNCDRIWIQQIKACDLDQNLLRNDWGDMRSNSGISNIWGQMAVDEEAGIVYFGTAQPGPDWNATYAPGFRLFGSAVMALDANNGDLVWAHQTTTRDLWDYDCSWNTILTTTIVEGEMRKVIIKGCKNGFVYVLDAATGEAYHLLDSPDIKRVPNSMLLDPRSMSDMTKPHQFFPDAIAGVQNCPAAGCLESDIAFDPVRNLIIATTYNDPAYYSIIPVESRAGVGINFGAAAPSWFTETKKVNSTINAWDADTGELRWKFFIDGKGYRGGTMVSGGLVWPTAVDATARAIDADTGELLYQTSLGTGSVVQPTIGANSNGDMMVFRVIGGHNFFGLGGGIGSTQPGAIMAYGLPDNLQETLAAQKALEERAMEAEAGAAGAEARAAEAEARAAEADARAAVAEAREPERVEVPVEVPVEVQVEVISPISYVAIGVGVVLVVIAGVLFARRRST